MKRLCLSSFEDLKKRKLTKQETALTFFESYHYDNHLGEGRDNQEGWDIVITVTDIKVEVTTSGKALHIEYSETKNK